MKPRTFDEECEIRFRAATEAEIKAARMAVKSGMAEWVPWLPCEDGECRICWKCRLEKTRNNDRLRSIHQSKKEDGGQLWF